MFKTIRQEGIDRLVELKGILEKEKVTSENLEYIDDLRLSIFRLENGGSDIGFQSLVGN